MRRRLPILAVACFIVSILISGCHPAKKAVVHKSSRQPRFIDDIYIGGHKKTNATANAIDPTRPKPKPQPKPKAPPKEVQEEADQLEETVPMEKCAIEPVFKKNTYSKKEETRIVKKYAEMIGVAPGDISNSTLYEFIDKWLGANYRLGGCSKAGIDCSGFAQKLYGEVYGTELLRTSMEQYANCRHIKHIKDAEEGDLVFFHIRSRKRITHVGIYLANDYFIHASTSGGVMISNLNEDYWHKYFAGAGRQAHGG